MERSAHTAHLLAVQDTSKEQLCGIPWTPHIPAASAGPPQAALWPGQVVTLPVQDTPPGPASLAKSRAPGPRSFPEPSLQGACALSVTRCPMPVAFRCVCVCARVRAGGQYKRRRKTNLSYFIPHKGHNAEASETPIKTLAKPTT